MRLRDFVRVIRRRWRLVLSGFLFGLVAAAALTFYSTTTYSSKVTFYIMPQGVGPDTVQAYQGSLLAAEKVRSYSQIVTSHQLLREVGGQLGITLDPESVTALAEPDTVLLTVTASDPSAERAYAIADAMSVVFPRFVGELEQANDPDLPPFVTAQVVEAAERASTPDSPRPIENAVLGGLFGIVLGVSAALVRTALDTSVRSPAELAGAVGAPVLGVLPKERNAAHEPIIVRERLQAPVAEGFRRVRTSLRAIRPSPKTLVVTSAVAGEGRTVVACNLAVTVARSGLRVLVLDADLRSPSVGAYLGFDRDQPGLTSVLRGEARTEDAVVHVALYGIDALLSGPVREGSAGLELLASKAFGRLLTELGSRYDLVLVDSPPVLSAAAAADVAACCDGALLVVQHGRTSRDRVQASTAALEAAGSRVVGAVLTMAPAPDCGALPRPSLSDGPATPEAAESRRIDLADDRPVLEPASQAAGQTRGSANGSGMV